MKYCPECNIGLNSREESLRFCQNCKAHWEYDLPDDDNESDFDEEYESFEPCSNCDLPDACADFGCAIKTGVRKDYPIDGVF